METDEKQVSLRVLQVMENCPNLSALTMALLACTPIEARKAHLVSEKLLRATRILANIERSARGRHSIFLPVESPAESA
jgi:hypothetical protein